MTRLDLTYEDSIAA
jgi:hypothetical protein